MKGPAGVVLQHPDAVESVSPNSKCRKRLRDDDTSSAVPVKDAFPQRISKRRLVESPVIAIPSDDNNSQLSSRSITSWGGKEVELKYSNDDHHQELMESVVISRIENLHIAPMISEFIRNMHRYTLSAEAKNAVQELLHHFSMQEKQIGRQNRLIDELSLANQKWRNLYTASVLTHDDLVRELNELKLRFAKLSSEYETGKTTYMTLVSQLRESYIHATVVH